MEVVDIAKADLNVETILCIAVILSQLVGLVRLGCGLVARYLDQLGDLDKQRELTIALCCIRK